MKLIFFIQSFQIWSFMSIIWKMITKQNVVYKNEIDFLHSIISNLIFYEHNLKVENKTKCRFRVLRF